jgi:ABC-type nickel/cobalt efflux system permease component RcnA
VEASVTVFFAGVAAGLVHVLAGPDHLAAVAPLAASRPRRAARAGMQWGLGHTGGVVLIAILALALREVLPIEAVSNWSERLVGVVLIAIGVWGLRIALSSRLHAHLHEHEGHEHAHFHVHRHAHARARGDARPDGAPAAALPAPRHRHTHAAFGVGILHGLAGSSHFLGVLPALALPSDGAAVAYVAGFGAGSIVAMTAYAACVGALARRSTRGPLHWYRLLLSSSAAAAVVVGCVWLAAA